MNSIESESLNDNRNQTARSETTLNNLREHALKKGWIEVTKNVYKTNNGNHIHLTGFNEKTKKYFFDDKDNKIPKPEDFDEMSLAEKRNNGFFVMEQQKAKKICKKYNPIIIDKSKKSFVIQVTALRREIDKLTIDLKPLGLISTSRTGAVAMTKGAKIFN